MNSEIKNFILQSQTNNLKTSAYPKDFSDLDAKTVSDDIVENAQDTMTLLKKYVDDLDVTLNKDKLKGD